MEPDEPEDGDPMGPPAVPCECFCLHCQRTFMSDGMWFQRVINATDGFPGFWMCPTPNCSGAGFTMDIFPTDPNHPANAGWHSDDDGDDDEGDPGDDSANDAGQAGEEVPEEEGEWDPAESKFEEFDDEDDDIEGEEWKHGIRPDEAAIGPPPMTEEQIAHQAAAQRERDEEEKRFDMPDERPRVIDWAGRDRPSATGDDAIPF